MPQPANLLAQNPIADLTEIAFQAESLPSILKEATGIPDKNWKIFNYGE